MKKELKRHFRLLQSRVALVTAHANISNKRTRVVMPTQTKYMIKSILDDCLLVYLSHLVQLTTWPEKNVQ